MKLYEVSSYIKKMINVLIGVVIVVAIFIYISPIISDYASQAQKATQKEVIANYVSPINFTQDQALNYNLSNTTILYIGNPDSQWKNLESKQIKLYEYNFSKLEDIDYLPTAKRIAFESGYDDLNLVDNGDISNKFVWSKNGLQFEINKVNKKMSQFPQGNEIAFLKSYVNGGNFISNNIPGNFALNFLGLTGRFTKEEVNSLILEPTFLRFESNYLVESNNISSELSYLKIYRSIENKKVVSKRYDFPQIYFFIASLRPEIENSFKNYRFPFIKLNKIDYKLSYNGDLFDLNPIPTVVESQLKAKNFVISEIKVNNSEFRFVPNKENTNIKTISVESVEVSYYDNFDDTSINTNIQPIYVFKGSMELASGEKGKITIYTPALNPKYYSTSK
jgi:hypothetical protein